MNVAYSLTASMVIFTVITIIYAVVKTISSKAPSDESSNQSDSTILMVYTLIFFISQVVINYMNSRAVCNNTKQSLLPIFLYTLFPFFFIFGSIMLMLQINKGWLNPFSNTIGYLIAMVGLNGSKEFTKLINNSKLNEEISTDNLLTINEIHKGNYIEIMKKLANNKQVNEIAYNEFYKRVILKDTIAECIWYLLAGFLTISITNNIIMNVKCDYDVKTMADIKKKADDTSKKSKKPIILQDKTF
jgi:hypothetical protein